MAAPATSGFTRVAWDLRYTSLGAERDGKPDKETSGVLAMPGTYTVELAKREDGVVTPLAGPVEFEVVRLIERGLPGMGEEELAAYLADMKSLVREKSAFDARVIPSVAYTDPEIAWTGLTETEAVEESSRCLSCGVCNDCDRCVTYCPDGVLRREGRDLVFDYDYCKGCGVCATECSRAVIYMKAG